MYRSDFHFDLPAELIAQQPLAERSASRLLALTSAGLRDLSMQDFPDLLGPEDLLIFNDTRVIPARLHARKPTGGAVEIMLERVISDQRARAFLRASKTPKVGQQLVLNGWQIEVVARHEQLFELQLATGDWWVLLDAYGEMPLPPYIQREPAAADRERYQTVFARQPGAVAAPTAGLHFDDELLRRLDAAGIQRGFLTLHVGAGTFLPMRAEKIEDHVMHAERLEVGEELVRQVERARKRGGRVVAVGTTVVRALETAAQAGGEFSSFAGESRLFITPGYRFQVVDAMLTNFHLPESTLLMLVSAFAGREAVMAAYAHAVEQRYRFFSYGDAMWLERQR